MVQQSTASFTRAHEGRGTTVPEDLAKELLAVEERIAGSKVERKIAAFDLDNTLLVGDIGEAVFASLKQKGYIPGFAWGSYRKLLVSNKAEAYCSVVRAMSGLPERTVHNVTLDLLGRRNDVLELEKSFIPVPFPHPGMVSFVDQLRTLGYQICVISASNEISARLAAWKFFSIPPSYVHGIRQGEQSGILTIELRQPLPIGRGKVEVYRKFVGAIDPLVSAGDSIFDVPLLQLTEPRGMSIWVGEEKGGYESIRQKIGADRNVRFLLRPPQLQFDEKGLDS